ncbi:MAG: hypothetical protein MJY85_08200 [Fibrobacter sp.]|nr:hypothetical protein [Fibrobacter sp.]
MSSICIENDLDVIEVPPELRGLSDEDIIKNSEKPLRECSGKRKNGAKRPSKKTRIAIKQQKELENLHQAAAEIFVHNSELTNKNIYQYIREKKDMLDKAFTKASKSYSFYEEETKTKAFINYDLAENNFKKYVSSSTIPSSARVLKASFGAKNEEKSKVAAVSAADLAQQRIEERARKIREALLNKRKKELSEV